MGEVNDQTPNAQNDLCLVKLNVGPGNPGPEGAPSTSKGIGIEIWLPSQQNWNKRVHNMGGGGFEGGVHGSTAQLVNLPPTLSPSRVAAVEGAVSGITDAGHGFGAPFDGSFAMNPDGTINTVLWEDFSARSWHELAVKTKALATAYYGVAPEYMYFEGASGGGREALKSAQAFPEDYDGIVSGNPAINWSRFITAEMYPQIVFQQDLGGVPMSLEQQDLVSQAAIAECGVVDGKPLGFILDPSSCRYDPTKDSNVLCVSDGGDNATEACVTKAQARVMNKFWYGMTTDGSVADPAIDNGWGLEKDPVLPSGKRRWFGQTRGTSTYYAGMRAGGADGLSSPYGPFLIASDQLALELQDPRIAHSNFVNAVSNGQAAWKNLSYSDLVYAYDQGVALQSKFAHVDSNEPDLAAFKAHGGKLLHWVGLSDEVIFPQGSINYYHRVIDKMNGLESVQSFYRLFLMPGMGHSGSDNGTANPEANPPALAPDQAYRLLTDWVENGIAPEQFVMQSASDSPVAKSLPTCAYPKKVTYKGSGDIFTASSYTCS